MESIVSLTDNEKEFFRHDDKSIFDNLTFGNFLNSCTDCGIGYSISKKNNLYNDDYYTNDDYYLGNPTQINVELTGNENQFSKLNCCVDSSGPNEITVLENKISDIEEQINKEQEKTKSLTEILEKIKSKFEQESEEDIFYSEFWEKALNIINDEIKSMEI